MGIVALLALLGCEDIVHVRIAGFEQGRPVFELDGDIKLKDFRVSARLPLPEDPGGNRLEDVRWAVRIADERSDGKELKRIVMGVTPSGFAEKSPVKDLVPGTAYEVHAWTDTPGKRLDTLIFKVQGTGSDSKAVVLSDPVFGLKSTSQPKGLIPESLRKAAENGDAQAQYEMGRRLYDGDGVWNDIREAYAWFLKAAKQGHARAQYEVGNLCVYHFVNQTREDAFLWHQKSALQGYANAQVEMGLYYHLGEVVKQGDGQAASWFEKAALQGNLPARDYLARLRKKRHWHRNHERIFSGS